jgi:hypothetical protein
MRHRPAPGTVVGVDERTETTVTDPGWTNGLWWAVLTALGAAAGWLIRIATGWVASLPWVPLPGPLELLARLPDPQATIAAVGLGTAAGLAIAYQGQRETLTATITTGRVALTRTGETIELPRTVVHAVFLDRKQLVVLGPAGDELARIPSDLDADRLRDAFERHGYPWHPADPYQDRYQRWVSGMPDLPPGADALLAARERALGRRDKHDVAELRTELAKLGIVVREPGQRQYWRRHTAPGSP